MINYLEKYNNLPKDLRDKISTSRVMDAIHDMENRYSLNLAGVVMRVVVKDLRIDELQNFFVYNVGINSDKANALIEELKEKVFSEVSNYLDYINKEEGAVTEKNELDDAPGLDTKTNSNNTETKQNNKGADFYFSIEDEDEVRQQAKDFSDLDKREELAKQVECKISNIMGQINVIFSSEDMSKRLQQVLKTYLRGVRDKVDTKLALEREIGKGGLGLDEEISDDILKIVDVINKDEAQHPGRVFRPREFPLPEDKNVSDHNDVQTPPLTRDADYNFDELSKEESLEKKEVAIVDERESSEKASDNSSQNTESSDKETESQKAESVNHQEIGDDLGMNSKKATVSDEDIEEDNLVLDLSQEKKEEPEEQEKIPEEKEEESKNIFSDGMIAKARNKQPVHIEKQEDSARQFGDMAGKIKMEDIKKVSKLGGPLAEIASMNLVDFRRISKDATEVVAKIMRMFELLEEDGFSKRMAGIKAWRKSPINKLYLSLGQESIVQQKDIKKIIEIRKKNKKEYLSQGEFDAIMELNTKLRY